MDKSLMKTRSWYEQQGRLGEFYKLYVCCHCRYAITCTGLNNDHRISCKEYKHKKVDKQQEPWSEMSYNRIPAYGSLSMQERMRREYREE